jgi:hypothetical protein
MSEKIVAASMENKIIIFFDVSISRANTDPTRGVGSFPAGGWGSPGLPIPRSEPSLLNPSHEAGGGGGEGLANRNMDLD